MKPFSIFLAFVLLSFTARAQNSYDEAIRMGDAALNKGQFKRAINLYFAAEAFDPSKKSAVQKKVNVAFDRIEALRSEANEAKQQAEVALAQVKEEQNKTKAALVETEKARLQADSAFLQITTEQKKTQSALSKANKLINAFYFYADRFALAFKDREFYFIDKNGDSVIKLGQWEKAEQFNWRGFAIVKKLFENNTYLLDTIGNKYPIVHSIKDLVPKITALDLAGDGISNLSKKIFQGSNLKILFLDHNKLTTLPSDIKKLSNLSYLDLSRNQLNKLPPEFGELINLTYLNLRENQLSKLPPEFGELINLTYLDLRENKLSSLLSEFGTLKSLSHLDLGRNNLNNLPPEFGELINLTYLDLRGNKLSSLPSNLGDLTSLTYLDLAANEISSLPKEFEQLNNLKILLLEGNPILQQEQEKIKKLLPNCEIEF